MEGKSLGSHGKSHRERKRPEKTPAPVLPEEPVSLGRASASQPRRCTGSADEWGISWFANEDVEEEEEEESSR